MPEERAAGFIAELIERLAPTHYIVLHLNALARRFPSITAE